MASLVYVAKGRMAKPNSTDTELPSFQDGRKDMCTKTLSIINVTNTPVMTQITEVLIIEWRVLFGKWIQRTYPKYMKF